MLQAAVRMADEGGIESLSMRKLARELGVEAMSPYNHVANKADLVDAIVDLVVVEIELPEGGEWDAAIRRCAVSAHAVFVQHPWACSFVMGPSPSSARLRYMEWLLGRLDDAGFSRDLTYHAYHTLDSHIVGFTLWEVGHMAGARASAGDKDLGELVTTLIPRLREQGYPNLAGHAEQHLSPPGDKTEFEFGLDVILEGLERERND